MGARTPGEVLDELLAISPAGVFPAEHDSGWANFHAPLADALATAEQRFAAMAPQVDPRLATDFLADYERVLGPDPLGRDQAALTLAARQQLACQRWVFRGGCSPDFYVALAANLGIGITVAEFIDSKCGPTECGDVLAPEQDELTWLVTMPETLVVEAVCNVSECGDALGSFVADPIGPAITLYAQPHTLPLFATTSTLTA